MENYLQMANQAISMSILRNMFYRIMLVKMSSVPPIHLHTFKQCSVFVICIRCLLR